MRRWHLWAYNRSAAVTGSDASHPDTLNFHYRATLQRCRNPNKEPCAPTSIRSWLRHSSNDENIFQKCLRMPYGGTALLLSMHVTTVY
ncbi:hypothetical protein F2P81_007826 [Scophthalmus maximus]|uniref:Uncharacterized protein n=1 Tax=Scophthalmus maximus TaxID=52904 RepID=A0A6A4T9B3_SCOMX|nr:hypothetical protein F2P81_007826 [Scophthalmus maximus]